MKTNKYLKSLLSMSYHELCAYLQDKYGFPPKPYFNKTFSKNSKYNTRTKEGLVLHHILENVEDDLSNPEKAKTQPYEWHSQEKLVYCDMIEHLILHIKISEELETARCLGLGGSFNWLIPELNDMYRGIQIKQPWKNDLYKKVLQNYSLEDYAKLVKLACDIFEKHKKKYNLREVVRPYDLFPFNFKYLDTRDYIKMYELDKTFKKHKIKDCY